MWYLAIIIAQCITQSIHYASAFKLRSEIAGMPTSDTIEPFIAYIAPPIHHEREIKVRQYAPLLNTHHGNEHTTKKEMTKTTEKVEKNEQEKLEPRTDKTRCYNNNYNQNEIHNVENYRPVSRSPGYNAVYRVIPLGIKSVFDHSWRTQEFSNEGMHLTGNSYPEKKFVEKVTLKVQYPKPPPSNHTSTVNKERKLEDVPTSSIIRPSILNVDVQPKMHSVPLLVRQPWGINNKHKVHLNLARAYNPGVQTNSRRYAGSYLDFD